MSKNRFKQVYKCPHCSFITYGYAKGEYERHIKNCKGKQKKKEKSK